MRTLYLVRHAKSSRDDPSLADRDRPLDDRGLRDAPKVGKRLAESIAEMPTCAVAEFAFDVKSWSDIGRRAPVSAVLHGPKQR